VSTRQSIAFEFFFNFALEYYVAGRAACASGCLFTTGNLLHHAVELLLKGELSRTVSLDDLKNKFKHSLARCWEGFKKLFPADDLAEFDQMIAELDKFEGIRYPDEMLKRGAQIGFGFGRYQIETGDTINGVPVFTMGIGHVDAFFARAFRLCHMNPKAYFSFLAPTGREMLLKFNDEAADWLA
jgi:hypothetical protein